MGRSGGTRIGIPLFFFGRSKVFLFPSREHQLYFLGYPRPWLPGRAINAYPYWIENVILGYKAWKLLAINSNFLERRQNALLANVLWYLNPQRPSADLRWDLQSEKQLLQASRLPSNTYCDFCWFGLELHLCTWKKNLAKHKPECHAFSAHCAQITISKNILRQRRGKKGKPPMGGYA